MKIRPTSKREEKQVLAGMLAGLNEPLDNRWVARFRRELISASVIILLIIVAFGVLYTHSFLVLFTTIGGLVVGLVAGVAAWRMTAARHWPVVSRCLDREKIEARLRELDA